MCVGSSGERMMTYYCHHADVRVVVGPPQVNRTYRILGGGGSGETLNLVLLVEFSHSSTCQCTGDGTQQVLQRQHLNLRHWLYSSTLCTETGGCGGSFVLHCPATFPQALQPHGAFPPLCLCRHVKSLSTRLHGQYLH